VSSILQAAELTGKDTVVEVGPGLGVMTSSLLDQAKKVVAIEIDPLLCQVLRDRFHHFSNFHLVQGDVLQQDFSCLIQGQYKVVANLPYYITSPFLIKLMEQDQSPQSAVILVQWEVARRLTALPGTRDYGSLTVFAQYHCQIELMARVAPGNFFPPPKVESAVVRLRWRSPEVRPRNESLMFRLVRIAFSQRRKMLKGLLARELGLERTIIEGILNQIEVSSDIRGEKLSVKEFAALADATEGYLDEVL
jgi:16S rRNA (adenine1518-N6/adenine1519-N6)-dimethyltransferase